MNCQHSERPNVMFPPLAPACHECAYNAWLAKGHRPIANDLPLRGKTYRDVVRGDHVEQVWI